MKQTIMKHKYEYHKDLTTLNKETFDTRYGPVIVTVLRDMTITIVHNRLEFQIPHSMSADALLKWKVTNRQLLFNNKNILDNFRLNNERKDFQSVISGKFLRKLH